MDEFFCKTRLFWSISRIIISCSVFFDLFIKMKSHTLGSESLINWAVFLYAVSLLYIGINEMRQKETNSFFLFVIGFLTMIAAVLLVSVVIGSLKSGYGFLFFFVILWMVVMGIKDIMGNHFYVED